MDFLCYIEHDAENLQFYLWYKDYVKRFFQRPDSEQALAPEWTPEQAQAEKNALEREKRPKKMPAEAAAVLKGTDFDAAKQGSDTGYNPFNTPPRTPNGGEYDPSLAASSNGANGFVDHNSTLRSGGTNHTAKTANAFENVDALQPCKYRVCLFAVPADPVQSPSSLSVKRSPELSLCTSLRMATECSTSLPRREL